MKCLNSNLSFLFSILNKITFAILFFLPIAVFSQNSAPTPIATPEQTGAIYLYGTPKIGTPSEQWESNGGERIIRNVVSPTITPFLPDSGKSTGAG